MFRSERSEKGAIRGKCCVQYFILSCVLLAVISTSITTSAAAYVYSINQSSICI